MGAHKRMSLFRRYTRIRKTMNLYQRQLPELPIVHDVNTIFRIVFTLLYSVDRSGVEVSNFAPVFTIRYKDVPVLLLQGSKIEIFPESNQIAVNATKTDFTGFDSVNTYQYTFEDPQSNTLLAFGTFRITGEAYLPGPYAAFGVSMVLGTAVNNDNPAFPVINLPPPPEIPETDLSGIEAEISGVRDSVNIEKGRINELVLSLQNISGFQTYTPVMVASSFITRSTGLPAGSADYRRTAPIPISALGNQIRLSIGNFGGSIAPIAYYRTASLTTASYISSEIPTIGGSNSAAGQQLNNYVATVPQETGYVVFSVHKDFALKIEFKTVDQATKDAQTSYIESAFTSAEGTYGAFVNPFSSVTPDAEKMFRKTARTVGLPADSSALIIVAGQSNADGRELKTAAPAWLVAMNYKIDNYMVWNRSANIFQSYELGVNTGAFVNNDTKFGFDIFFAKAWLDANPTKKLYAIKQTAGGVPITHLGVNNGNNNYRWQPKTDLIATGQLSMVNELAAKITAVKSFAVTTRLRLTPVAVLYHQGEGDADRVADGGVTDYPANLANLISAIRGMMQAPALPWLTATLHPVNANYIAVSSAITQLDGLDPNMKAVNMSGNTQTIDGLHFSVPALTLIGQTMYNDLLTL